MKRMPCSEVAEIVSGMTLAMWDLVLHGCDTQIRKPYYEAIGQPRPGDMVVEVSTQGFPAGHWRMLENGWEEWRGPLDRVGTLLRVEEVYQTFDQEGNRMPLEGGQAAMNGDPEAWMERRWVIRTLDGREARWHNCRFIRAITEPLEK